MIMSTQTSLAFENLVRFGSVVSNSDAAVSFSE